MSIYVNKYTANKNEQQINKTFNEEESTNLRMEQVKDVNETTEVAEKLVTTKEQNDTHMNSRVVERGGVYFGRQGLNTEKLGMATDRFDHMDILDQRIHVYSGTWSNTDAEGTVLAQVIAPYFVDSTASMMRQILQTYAYTKPNFIFEVQLNTVKFNYGKALLVWDPLNIWQGYRDNNVYTASCLPFVEIDAGDSNSAELVVPYDYFANYWITTVNNPTGLQDNDKAMGAVRLIVLNPLQSTQSVETTVGFQVFAQLTASALEMPIQPHSLWADTPAMVNHSGLLKSYSLMENHSGLRDFTSGFKMGTTKVSNFVSRTSEKVREVPVAGPVVSEAIDFCGKMADKVTGVFETIADGVADFFDFDKPTDPQTTYGNMLTTMTPLSYLVGPDSCVRLSTNPLANYFDTKFSVATSDDTHIETMVQRPCIQQKFTWSSTQTPGTLLASWPVAPACHYEVENIGGSNYHRYNPSWANFMSFYHDQWTGDLIWFLDFATSQFHSGRFLIVYTPGTFYNPLNATDVLTANTSNPHIVADLRECKQFTFRVGYNGTTESKQCVPYGNLSNINSIYFDNNLNLIMGTISIYVMNPIRVPNGDTTVEVNVWHAGGENLRYDYPNRRPGIKLEVDLPTVMENHSGADVLTRDGAANAPNIIKGPSGAESRDRFGERVRDVRDLCKRPALFKIEYPAGTAFDVLNVNPLRAAVPSQGTRILGSYADSFMYVISEAYAFWSGAIRFRVLPQTNRSVSGILTAQTFPFNPNRLGGTQYNEIISGPVHIQSTAQEQAMQVEVPYISSFAQSAVHDVATEVLSDASYVSPMIFQWTFDDKDTANTKDVYIATSAGNDYALRVPVCPPTLFKFIGFADNEQ